MKIIKTSEALPKSGRYVLAWLEGAKIPMRAMWADQHTLPLGDDADPEWGEYSEEKDEYFCPAGWYEMNQFEEQHWGVSGNVVAWCELPRLDHQCLAQIEEPAQPVCWIRFCSDGSTEGPIMHSQICEARKTSGAWTPLYAGAAPAAVSPRGEYPHEQMDAMALDRYKVVPSNASMLWSHAVVAGDGAQQLYVGREVECQNMARKFAGAFLDGAFAFHSMAAAPTAQAAPALEAPAAPVSEREAFEAWFSAAHHDRLDRNMPDKSYNSPGAECAWGAWQARAALAAAPQAPRLGEDALHLLHRLLSNQHTLTGPEFRAELEKIVSEESARHAAAPQAPAALDELRQIADIAACWGCDHPDAPGDTELLRRIKWAARQLRAVSQAPVAPVAPAEPAGKAHDWRENASYGGEICAECGATKGSRRGNAPCTWPPAKTAKRWPFLESPGEFTARLEAAIRSFGGLLPAVRNVLIEHPPTLVAAPAAPAVDAWLQPDDMAALQRFHETAEDDESYDIGKEAVARLCAFGCLQSHSFGRYSTTDFGDYLLDTWAGARTLPFTTAAERAAQAAAKGASDE